MRRISTLVLVLAGVSLASGLYLCRTSPSAVAERERAARSQATPPVGSAPPADERAALAIATQTVRREPLALRAEVASVLGPVRHVRIAAEVEGRVVDVPVEEHSAVEAGDVLVQLERSLLDAAARRAAAAASRAEANYELARLELARQKELRARRVASEADHDRAVNAERARLAELREAEAAQADARVRLQKTAIRAPFSGIVNSLDLEPGAYLRPGEFVAELLDLSAIEIEVGVTDRQVVALREGQGVTVLVDVFPGQEFEGRVHRIGSSADPQTQKYPVQVRVPNEERELLPGMLGTLRFAIGQGEPSIQIPRAASQSEYEVDYVFVVNGDPSAPIVERRRVAARPVPFRPDLLQVTSGLEAGERIATTSVRQLRDGLRVSVLPDVPDLPEGGSQ